MPCHIFTPEWVAAWERELAASDGYREAAADWVGSIASLISRKLEIRRGSLSRRPTGSRLRSSPFATTAHGPPLTRTSCSTRIVP